MNPSEVKILAREVVWEFMDNYICNKRCPKCKADCNMVKFSVIPEEKEESYEFKLRCLNCLGVFTEELKEVVSE